MSLDEVGVKALNANTLRVDLEYPTAYFLDLTCTGSYFPVRKEIVENSEPWTRNAKTYICNGPFYLKEIKPREKYVLQKNPNYLFASKVKLEHLEMDIIEAPESQLAAYETGEIQVFDDPTIEGIKKYKGTKELMVFPRIGMSYYDFNTTKKPFDDVRVRRAFALALNRDQIVKHVLQTDEKPAYGYVPYGIPHGLQRNREYRDVVGNVFH